MSGCHGVGYMGNINHCKCEEEIQNLKEKILFLKNHISRSDVGLSQWQNEIVKEINELREITKRISEDDMRSEKPHECPVCDGMCKFKVFGQDREAACPACQGKGIVWR